MKVLAWRVPLAVAGLVLLSPNIEDLMTTHWFRIFGFVLVYLGAGCLLLSSLSLDYFRCPAPMRWLAWLGKYSYSVYLWHILAGGWLIPLLGAKGNNLAGWILNAMIYLVGCWVIGFLLARLIELPALRWRDNWFPSQA